MIMKSSADRKTRSPQRAIALMVTGILLFLLTGLFLTTNAGASSKPQTDATPTPSLAPTPTFDLKRLDKPAIPAIPAQVDQGLIVYSGI